MRAGDVNEADKAVFGQILVEFKKQIVFDSIMVCDRLNKYTSFLYAIALVGIISV